MLCAQVMTPLVFVCKVSLCALGTNGTWTIIGSSLGNMLVICSLALCSLVSVTCHLRLCTCHNIWSGHQTMTLNSFGLACDVESKISCGSIVHGLSSHIAKNLFWGMRLLFMHELLFVVHNLIHDSCTSLQGKTQGIKHGIGSCKVFIGAGVTVELHCKAIIQVGSASRIGCIIVVIQVVMLWQ